MNLRFGPAAFAVLAFWSGTPFAAPSPDANAGADRAAPETPLRERSTFPLLGGFAFGKGFRFNDPYRLQTELGNSAESVSTTATYFDAFVGATIGNRGRFSNGIAVHASFALGGVPQEVITPSYLFFFRPLPRWGVLGRAGIPIVVEPDTNAGFELAAGGVFYATAAIGVTAEVVGDLFFGAATLDTSRTAIPLLSGQIGLLYEYEVLP
jgi:hypothetical protein